MNVNALAPLAPNAWLRYDTVARMLPAGIVDVLEIGCGQGGFAARLAQRYRYLGVEPDHASWTVAERRISAVGADRSAMSRWRLSATNGSIWSAPSRCSSTSRTTRAR